MQELSPLEKQIVILVAKGYSNNSIAKELRLANQTVRNYLTKIFEKVAVKNRTQLSNLAWQSGWTEQER